MVPPPAPGRGLNETHERRQWRAAIAIVVAAGLVRLIVAGLTPLFPDETYYWEWSRRLAAGYFDHPPAIAWVIRAGTLVAGDTPLGVRLGAVVVGALGTLLICLAARDLAGDRAAFVTALIFALMPLSAAGLILATPDAPLLAAVAATTWTIGRALAAEPRSGVALRWWCAAGLALGVGLLSKYTAVLVPAGVVIAFLSRADLRRRLAEPGPYVATGIALLVFLPVVLWNAAHGWASFAFQLQHGLGGASGSALGRVLEMIGGQLGLVSPILFVMAVLSVREALGMTTPVVRRVLAVVSLFVFAFFMYSATRRRVEANWPAIAYVSAVVLLVGRARTRRWDRWLVAGLALAGVITAVTYANAFAPILPVPARRDPAARAHGWQSLARAVDSLYAPRRALSSSRTWIAADRYQEASELAFHVAEHPETFALNLSSRANNYDLWPTFRQRGSPGDAMILVVDDVEGTHPTVALLAPHFAGVTRGDLVPIARNGDQTKRLRIWLLQGWRGSWPEAAPGSRH